MYRIRFIANAPTSAAAAAAAAGLLTLALTGCGPAPVQAGADPNFVKEPPGAVEPPERPAGPVASATIPGSEILCDKLLERIPPSGKFFRDHLADAARSFNLSVHIPRHKSPDGYIYLAWPHVNIGGVHGSRRADGYFDQVDVAVLRATHYLQQNQHEGRRLQLLLTASYVMPGQTAVMVVPFSLNVWRDNQDKYSYGDLKVDWQRVAVSATQEPTESKAAQ